MSRFIRAVACAAALALPAVAAGGIAESWYLSRGRANMQIRNYAAAVEAYRKALEADPRSREASRGLCLALLGNGDTDLAVAELDRHLGRFPDDWELAFEQARILQWSRYAYRAKDAARYLRMALARHEDPARRLQLARLLGRDRATLGEALAEYDRLLEASPGDRTLRQERLKLLLWDPARREAAIAELRRRLAEAPRDDGAAENLARLLATDARTAPEACDLYAGLLSRRPDDPDLRLGHARALVRAGRRAEARAAYDRVLALRPTTEARLERADLLAADPSTRDAARADYEAVIRTEPRSRRAHLGLARTLGARKETSGAAIREYQTVLASSPRDAEAHRGLAHAYAWTGDSDRALAHGDLAERYGPPRADLDETTRALRRGREPAAGAGARLLEQPGGDWALASVGAFARGAAEPTPFTHSDVEAGFASHRGAAGVWAEGAVVRVRGAWRPDPGLTLALEGGWDAARLRGQGFSGALRVLHEGERASWALWVERAPRLDSFRAYAGEDVGGRVVGAVSEQVAAARVAWTGAPARIELTARGGTISGPGISPVLVAAASGRADVVLARPAGFSLTAGGLARAVHHARDLSGLDGDASAPRVFSPPLELDLSPRLGLARDDGLAGGLLVDAGPALQVVTGPRGGLHAGGDVRAALWRRFADRLRVQLEGSAERVAAAYARYTALLSAEVLFP